MSQNSQTVASYEVHTDDFIETRNMKNTVKYSQWIVDQLSDNAIPLKIAEVGAGPGYTADYLETLGYSVDRSDAAESFVQFMLDHGKQAIQLNIVTDTFKEKYDIIIAINVMQHMSESDFKLATTHIRDALHERGRFIFSITIGDGSSEWHDDKGGARYFLNWPLDVLRKELRDAGFAVTMEQEVGYKNWINIVAEKI